MNLFFFLLVEYNRAILIFPFCEYFLITRILSFPNPIDHFYSIDRLIIRTCLRVKYSHGYFYLPNIVNVFEYFSPFSFPYRHFRPGNNNIEIIQPAPIPLSLSLFIKEKPIPDHRLSVLVPIFC